MLNHSLKTFRGVGDPGRRMKTAYPRTTCASSSTIGVRRATTIERLKFCRLATQSLLPGPGAGPCPAGAPRATGAAPPPPGPCPRGAPGGRNAPAGAGDPLSTRPQPGNVKATEPSCDVIAS